MHRLPPTPPLFPYTTLFRSVAGRPGRELPLEQRRPTPRHRQLGTRPLSLLEARPADGDRKSTRLNSSHVAISYAVFCLKKKNNRLLPAGAYCYDVKFTDYYT